MRAQSSEPPLNCGEPVEGFDDQPLASNLVQELTTVELPYAQMGEMAVDLLEQMMRQKGTLPTKINRLKGRVMLRSST